jgi:hypothetical protein
MDRLPFVIAKIRLFDRAWFLRQLPRLIEGANYNERMRRAGVPDKVRQKIMRRWNGWAYALRQEMKGLIKDIEARGFNSSHP